MKPRAEPGEYCPFWKKDVSKVCHTCHLYECIKGKAKDGEPTVQWACAIRLIPTVMVQNTNTAKEVTEAVEALRKDVQNTSPIKVIESIARAAPQSLT